MVCAKRVKRSECCRDCLDLHFTGEQQEEQLPQSVLPKRKNWLSTEEL
jgi:alkylhydroperoxidase family enzyme